MDLDILRAVEKPSRYLGGEVNQIRKDPARTTCRIALCYPDVYEIGMSHNGLKILYAVVNGREDFAAERVYAPWPDMEGELRSRGLPLTTLESHTPLRDFDVIGFTLQYELSYTNLLTVLDLGGMPLRAEDRGPGDPVVIAGGPCAFNPEPLAPFLDAVCLGDGEDLVLDVMDVVAKWRDSGAPRGDLHRLLAQVEGIYVPSLYQVDWNDDGTVRAIVPAPGQPPRVRKRVLPDLDASQYPTREPVPHTKIVHDRYGVEIQRGCMRGCRFCQAGYIYRPERQRSPERVRGIVREGTRATGWEEFSLLSLSVGDYNCIEPLLLSLMDEHEASRTAVSMPSMRLESLTPAIMEQVGRVRKTSFTVAPEAASPRLRAVINKVIDEQVLLDMVGQVFAHGWRSLKLYFMLGLPTEQDEDLKAMIDLGSRCLDRARQHCRDATITVNVSSFVPKPHTPFQWCPQVTLAEVRRKQLFLRRNLRRAGLSFRFHESRATVMEGVFSRGDRRTAALLEAAWRNGARFDGWQERLDEGAWSRAMEETGIDPAFYNQRRRDPGEVLPWSHIDCGVDPDWLWEDWMRSLEAGFVPDCSEAPCYDCGVCDHRVVKNEVFDEDAPGLAPRERPRREKRMAPKTLEEVWVDGPRTPGMRARLRAEAALAVAPQVDPPCPAPSAVSDPADRWRDVVDVRLPLEMRLRVRLRFARLGRARMLSHLEVMSAFQRALRRLEIPVLWSAGFHPHMRLQWGPPLPVGVGSETELCDVEVRRPHDLSTLARDLSAQLPEGLDVLHAWEVPVVGPSIEASIVSWTWRLEAPPDRVEAALARLAEGPVAELSRDGKARSVPVARVILDATAASPDVFRFRSPAGGAGIRVGEGLAVLFGADVVDAGFVLVREGVELAPPAAPQGRGAETPAAVA